MYSKGKTGDRSTIELDKKNHPVDVIPSEKHCMSASALHSKSGQCWFHYRRDFMFSEIKWKIYISTFSQTKWDVNIGLLDIQCIIQCPMFQGRPFYIQIMILSPVECPNRCFWAFYFPSPFCFCLFETCSKQSRTVCINVSHSVPTFLEPGL